MTNPLFLKDSIVALGLAGETEAHEILVGPRDSKR